MDQRIAVACFVLALSAPATGQHPSASQAQIAGQQLPNAEQERKESQPEREGGQAQQGVKEARVELERAALRLERADQNKLADALRDARLSLDQFDQSLEQLSQSLSGKISLQLAESLQQQTDDTRRLLDSQPDRAATSMHELSLRVTDLTAEADLLIGKQLLGTDGEWLGVVTNVLITGDGRIQALVIEQGGEPGMGERQVALEWSQIGVSGRNLSVNMSPEEAFRLPGYVPQ